MALLLDYFIESCKDQTMDPNRLASKFLGIPYTENPWMLLGIASGNSNAAAIANALRRRLAQLEVHPHAQSQEANIVRTHLEEVAVHLQGDCAPPPPTSAESVSQTLSPLDQAIIAALISEGGWNNKSRSRLVGVAASYSITVGALMRILEAFAKAARSGDGPLSRKKRVINKFDRSWVSVPKKKMSTTSAIESMISKAAEKITPELSSPTPEMTVGLAVFFSLLTLAAFILSLVVLLGDTSESLTEGSNSEEYLPRFTQDETTEQELKVFEQYPTFFVEGFDQSILEFAGQGVQQLPILRSLTSSLEKSLEYGKAPDDAIVHDWEQSLSTLSFGWPFIDSHTLQAAKTSLIQVLLAAEMYPGFAQQLVQSFRIPRLRSGEPLNIIRSIWSSGVLASLGCDLRLGQELRLEINKLELPEINTCNYLEARVQALIVLADQLLERTEFDDRVLEDWEAWLLLVKELSKKTSNLEPQLHVLTSIVSSDIDLLRNTNTRKVLGRIIRETDWVSSVLARDTVTELIRSRKATSIDLSLLTSLFYNSGNNSWFPVEGVVSQSSSLRDRKNISSQLKKDWPIDSSESISTWVVSLPIGLDVALVEEWEKETERLVQRSNSPDFYLVKLRLLNEAAVSIWKGRPDFAKGAIERAKLFEIESVPHPKLVYPPTPGSFSDAWSSAGNVEEKLVALQELSEKNVTDLSKRDADRLVGIAIKSRSELRKAATDLIIYKFANAENIANSLLYTFAAARTKEQIAALVANLTDVILPEPTSQQWDSIARSAFVQHALTVAQPEVKQLDEIASELSTSLLSEFLLLNPEYLSLSSELSPNVAFQMLVDTWRTMLPPMYQVVNPEDFVPTGLLQKYLKKQLEYLLLLKGEEAKWRNENLVISSEYITLSTLHNESSIIDQLVSVEKQISIHWLRLFKEVTAEYERRMNK